MTVSSTNSSVTHLGTGAQLAFPFDFEVDDLSTLNTYVAGVLQLSGYTVSGIGNPAGGVVTFAVAPADGVNVYLQRVLPLTQETDYTPYDSFPAESHEKALDKLTDIAQQLQEQLNRVAVQPPGTTGVIDYNGAILRDIGNAVEDQDATPMAQVTGLVSPYAASASSNAAAASNSAATAQAAAASVVPNYVGEITVWSAATAPSEYLLCDGAAYSQAAQPALYQVIGASFNTGGEAPGDFRVPSIPSIDPDTPYIIRSGAQTTNFIVPLATTQDTSFVGQVAFFQAAPSGWLQLNGQAVSKSAYPDLWAYGQNFLTTDQAVDPGLYMDIDASNFRVPNLSGLFIRGLGTAPGTGYISGALGARQDDALQVHLHFTGVAGTTAAGGTNSQPGNQTIASSEPISPARTAAETRPANVALMPCVRATRLGVSDPAILNNFLNGMVGAVFWKHAVPTGFVQSNGQTLSKAVYPNLWAYAQAHLTTDQAVNPGLYLDVDASNFKVPKLDGLFLRAAGSFDGNHVASAVGATQGDTNQAHAHSYENNPATGGAGLVWNSTASYSAGAANTTGSSGGSEARPVNVSMIPCIFAG